MPSYSPLQGSYFAHKITLEGVGEDAFAQSLSTARVDMNPHQIDAALFALASPLTKGVLLADEVGLGKTIEAALVIAQKWAERRRRILLIVPASLRKQWSQELADKFSLSSVIIEAKVYNEAKKRVYDRSITMAVSSLPLTNSRQLKLTTWRAAAGIWWCSTKHIACATFTSRMRLFGQRNYGMQRGLSLRCSSPLRRSKTHYLSCTVSSRFWTSISSATRAFFARRTSAAAMARMLSFSSANALSQSASAHCGAKFSRPGSSATLNVAR